MIAQEDTLSTTRLGKGYHSYRQNVNPLCFSLQHEAWEPDPLARYPRPVCGPEKCHGMGEKKVLISLRKQTFNN